MELFASIALFRDTVRHSLGISHMLLLLPLIQYTRYQSCIYAECWKQMPDDYNEDLSVSAQNARNALCESDR